MRRGVATLAVACLGFTGTPAVIAEAAEPDVCVVDQDVRRMEEPRSIPKGTLFYVIRWDSGWYEGTLWGNPKRIWLHYSVLGPPCGD